MSKLSFDALAARADQVATDDLLSSINGGTENDCHPEPENDCNDEPEESTSWSDALWNEIRSINMP